MIKTVKIDVAINDDSPLLECIFLILDNTLKHQFLGVDENI